MTADERRNLDHIARTERALNDATRYIERLREGVSNAIDTIEVLERTATIEGDLSQSTLAELRELLSSKP